MYIVDGDDRVRFFKGVPVPETGAPMTRFLCNDSCVVLSYLIASAQTLPLPKEFTFDEADPYAEHFAIVRFHRYCAVMYGPPNDEALNGHPLYARGLQFYDPQEVEDSSWIRELERMNRVHSRHDPKFFAKYRHFIFAFHDATFECIAEGLEFELRDGSLEEIHDRMKALLTER